MKNGNARRRSRTSSLILIGTFVIAAAAFIVPVYSVHSSSLSAGSTSTGKPVSAPAKTSQIGALAALRPSIRAPWTSSNPLLPIPTDSPETIETFAADCTTPRTVFVLGETVCAVVNYVTESDRFVNWISPPDSHVAFSSPTIPDNLTHSYTYVPTVTGGWKATIADPSDSSIIPTYFDVVEPGPINTYASGCAVPQVVFNLGNAVCAKVTGGLVAPRRIAWTDPSGYVRQVVDITTDPQNDTFNVPGTPTSTLSNGVEVTNVGTWRASVISSRGSLVAYSVFFVNDPSNATADVSVSKTSQLPSGQISAGSTNIYPVAVYNSGPGAAQNVVVTDVVPANMTFVSITPAAGCVTPGPGGTGTITCTIPTLARGDSIIFEITLQVIPGTAAGTQLSNTATVAANTNDPISDNNSSTASLIVSDTGTATCTLTCPGDMTVEANTTQAGNPGAFIDFSAASGVGSCGTISNDPSAKDANGDYNFFGLGSHLITSTSQSGDTCTFTVTVVDTPPPTISCPPNQTVTAASGESSATVNVGTPTTNPSSGVTVIGIRSDDPTCTEGDEPGCTPVPLTDPYPVGTTTILWTVTQSNGQKASCTQTIRVNDNACAGDTTAPVITAPPDINVGTGPDPALSKLCTVGLDDELGTAEVTESCSYNVATTGIPANNAFPVGTTTVTYTATDGAGNSASDTQLVTVFDNTPPIIVAPPDASYTCMSEVPAGAAAIALARGDNPDLPNGGPPTDNCGAPVVTYSDSSTGAGSVASPRVITRTYVATDTSPLHNSASAVQTITVIDPTPPTIVLTGANPQYVECHTSYPELGATANDNCGDFAATPSGTVNVNVPGTYTITYNATDWAGNAATAVTRTVIVQDTIAPTINLTGFAPSMWPPSHEYVPFLLTQFVTGATDSCDTVLGISSVVIEKVTSDEVENGAGDGDTLNDIVIAADCKSVQLRAERQNNGNGRVYTITFKVTDASGNVGRATAKVFAPKNLGQTSGDSGVHYTVNGTCP
jgi:uncharacterized repeat protein (TIGR01451 family)